MNTEELANQRQKGRGGRGAPEVVQLVETLPSQQFSAAFLRGSFPQLNGIAVANRR
jgi:hypothetical protein